MLDSMYNGFLPVCSIRCAMAFSRNLAEEPAGEVQPCLSCLRLYDFVVDGSYLFIFPHDSKVFLPDKLLKYEQACLIFRPTGDDLIVQFHTSVHSFRYASAIL